MKLIPRLALALVALLVLAVLGVLLWFDSIVGAAIERGGSLATGAAVKVASVDASLFSGKFSLKGLELRNPPGFRDEAFVALGAARTQWKNGTLLSETIEIDELSFEDVAMNLERTNGKSNWGTILDNLQRVSGGAPAPGGPASSEKKRSVLIHRIVLDKLHGALHIAGIPLGVGETKVEIPRVEIDEFRTNGSTSEIVGKLLAAIVNAALEQVASAAKGIFPKDVLDDLGGSVNALGKSLKDGAKGLESGVKSLLQGAGDLFPGKKR